MSNYQLYAHSVIGICMRLHGCDTGTSDGMPDDERRELVEWLRWRINNWTDSRARDNERKVDNAVRKLAIAVLDQADNRDSDCDGEDE